MVNSRNLDDIKINSPNYEYGILSKDDIDLNFRLLKNLINKSIFIAKDMKRSENEIAILIEAGDIIDNIEDQLNHGEF